MLFICINKYQVEGAYPLVAKLRQRIQRRSHTNFDGIRQPGMCNIGSSNPGMRGISFQAH